MNTKFASGRIVATPGALNCLTEREIARALYRHLSCDWGEVSCEDWRRNDEALISGERLFSAYISGNDERFWIITEADRSATTLLLPEEY